MSDFKVNDFLKLCELGKGIPSEAKEFGPYKTRGWGEEEVEKEEEGCEDYI